MHHVRSSRGLRFADRAMDLAEVTELIASACIAIASRLALAVRHAATAATTCTAIGMSIAANRPQIPPSDNAAVDEDSYDASSGGET